MEDLGVNPSFWAGRRVLLTGHTGFKGSWLSLWLEMLGAHVTGYSLEPPSEPSLFELAGVAGGMTSVHGDVRDLDHLQRVSAQCRPEIVIHMAAQALVRRSYQDPVGTFSTNVLGTVNVLEAARFVPGVRAVLVVTSDKCYEPREGGAGYREGDPLGGSDPYSSSKACAEIVTAAYHRSFLHPGPDGSALLLASARAGNVIGGGDWAADRLIPDVLGAFAEGRSPLIRSPQAVRPWQHVLEPLSGYLLLAERLHAGDASLCGAWNFGPGDLDCRTVAWVVDRLATLWGNGAAWQHDLRGHPHEAAALRLDCSKARRQLAWNPNLTLQEALAWTVDWHRRFRRGERTRRLTQEQIARYQARLALRRPRPAAPAVTLSAAPSATSG